MYTDQTLFPFLLLKRNLFYFMVNYLGLTKIDNIFSLAENRNGLHLSYFRENFFVPISAKNSREGGAGVDSNDSC